jgi:hypothetical protein
MSDGAEPGTRPPDRTGRHRAPRGAWAVTWRILAAVGVVVVLWASVTFFRTWSSSDGEPLKVIVATWMRDNHMGPLVAQLEDVYYEHIDTAEVGGTPTTSADVTAEDNAGLDAEDPAAEGPAAGSGDPEPSATGAGSRPLLLTPVDRDTTPIPQPTTSPEPVRAHLQPPPPIVSPVDSPERKEGEWQPVGSRVDGIPAIYVTRVRADDVHTSYYASVMWIDTELTKAMFIPGYEEPGGPNPYDGALPRELWPDVLANFNGGFRLEGTLGGYYYDGETVKPLVKGKASAVVYEDGTLVIGKWGRDVGMGRGVLAVRQNLDLIVDKGQSKVTNGADSVVWGATTDKESLAWRSAIGQRKDGSIVYVGSPYLSAEGLGNVLVGAGVERAMVLDMNDWWTAGFYFRHKKNGTPLCRKLDPSIQEGCDRFLNRYKRDSFQFLAAPAPLARTEGASKVVEGAQAYESPASSSTP